MKIKVVHVLLLGLCINTLYAQNLLSEQEAVAKALKNNFDIQIATNIAQISANNNTIGNAGFLPSVNINASQNGNINNTHQIYFSGTEKEASNALSNSLTANIAMNWTIFDGMEMFMDKKRLQILENMGETQLHFTIENTVYQTIMAYYTCVNEQKKLDILKEALAISKERKTIVMKRYSLGSASLPEVNQSDIYLNADSAAYLNQLLRIMNAKSELNYIMGQEAGTSIEVETEIPVTKGFLFHDILTKVQNQNSEVNLMRQNMMISELELKKSRSQLFPEISVIGGYNTLKSESEVGILQSNQTYGYNFGINASFPIFNGSAVRRNIKNNVLLYENSQIALRQTEYNIQKELLNLYNAYKTQLDLLKLAKNNLESATSNFNASMEIYKQGMLSEIEFREKQINLIEAENSLLNAQFQAKISETALLLYTGELVKE